MGERTCRLGIALIRGSVEGGKRGKQMIKYFYIAICDDEAYYRNRIRELLEQYCRKKEFVFQIDEYPSGKAFLKAAEKLKDYYQIVFMDVDMPDMRGTDTAKALRERNNNAVFCFVTAYEQYAYEAFRVEALDYIVKPPDYAKLARFLDKALAWKALEWEQKEAEKRYLSLPQKPGNRLVVQENILYLEKRRNQCVVVTETEEIICYDTLQNLYCQLNESIFVYTHQGYIVNFYRVKELRNNIAFLGNGREIPVSRKYWDALKKRFEEKLERLRQEKMAQKTDGR